MSMLGQGQPVWDCLFHWASLLLIQGTSDGVFKSLEPPQSLPRSQVNGNNGTLTKEEKSDRHLPAPSQCALSSENSVCDESRYFPVKNGEQSLLGEQNLGTVARQKEEWQATMALPDQEEGKTYTCLIWGPPTLEEHINAYPRFTQDFVAMSYCIHPSPCPVFFWASRPSGLLLGKVWSKMNGNRTGSYCQL